MCVYLHHYRGDFRILFNPDGTEDKNVLLHHRMELACYELADLSYKLQISSMEGSAKLPNGLRPIYKGFVYSRMLWRK